jgi:hypothetical protein
MKKKLETFTLHEVTNDTFYWLNHKLAIND